MSSLPTQAEVDDYLVTNRNWGRWGPDDQRGTLNLLTDESRLRALHSARTGQAFSLSRPLPTWTGADNTTPAQHYMRKSHNGGQNTVRESERSPGGFAADFYGTLYHGVTTTHLDALCHVWDADGMYNGRDPDESITFDGARFGGVEHWSNGITARAVLLDVPRFRGVEYVTQETPVHGWELEAIVESSAIDLQPGDAVCIYSGRDRWQLANLDQPYGRYPVSTHPASTSHGSQKPGLHASCLWFLREHDVSVLVWDMMDMTPHDYDIPWAVHGAIHSFGLAVLDNAALETFADVCAEHDRTDFLLLVAPLLVNGGTGSPVNPIAIL